MENLSKLKIVNLKFHADMSEETNCYSADLKVGREKIAHIKNDGRGGMSIITPYPNYWNIIETFRNEVPRGEFLEDYIDCMVFKKLQEKEKKKMLKLTENKIVFIYPDHYSSIGFKGKKINQLSENEIVYLLKSSKVERNTKVLNKNLDKKYLSLFGLISS